VTTLAPRLPDLPRPPILQLLLEQPHYIAAGLLFGGVVAWAFLRRRGLGARGLAAVGVAAGAALGIELLAAGITTPRERILARTRDLVRAVAGADAGATGLILADDARLRVDISRLQGALSDGMDREEILGLVRTAMRSEFRVREHRIVEARAAIDGPNVGRTLVRVRVVPESGTSAHYSWWQLDWRLEGGAWRAFVVQPRWIQFVGS
jgi:hypothetical protein